MNEALELSLDEALQKVGVGIWQIQLVLTLCVGVIADAAEATLLSFLGPCAQHEFSLTTSETSFINSVVFMGAMVGAMFFGFFADLKGRRSAYALSLGILFVFGAGTFFTRSYFELLLCRGFVGFGLGGGLAPFDFLSETVPPNIRGICCLLSSLFWGIGSVLTVGAAWLTLDVCGWRSVALLCSVPVLLALLTVFFLPESPRWLLSQGRKEEALVALQRAAKSNGVILEKFTLKSIAIENNQTNVQDIFKQPLRKTTFLLIINWASFGFCYYAIIQLSTKIFEDTSSADHCSFSFSEILIPALSEPFMIIVTMFFVEKSRRITQSLNYFLAGTFSLLLGLPFSLSTLAMVAFFARGCMNVSSSVTWVVTPECYPTHIRATAHAFFYNTARIGACLSSFWIYSSLPTEQVCGLISGLCFLSGVSAMCMHETAGHQLDAPQDPSATSFYDSNRWKHSRFNFFESLPSLDDQQQKSMLHSIELTSESC